jgi:hypothetical protein
MHTFLKKSAPVIIFGTIWGALELFGVDLLRYFDIPNKSAWIYAITLAVMMASKKITDFPISVTVMAIIASTFKTASTSFFACQVAAVMINGLLFDFGYRILKSNLETNMVVRSLTGFVLAVSSFALFAITATFLIREIHWLERGWPGVLEFTITSGLMAAAASVLTINIGHWLGNHTVVFISKDRTHLAANYLYAGSIIIVVGIWLIGQLYRT